jgi:hypothetical protein
MDLAREMVGSNKSPRTLARCAAAFHNLEQCSEAAYTKVFKECWRPNRSLNVSQLLQRSIDLWYLEHPDPDKE